VKHRREALSGIVFSIAFCSLLLLSGAIAPWVSADVEVQGPLCQDIWLSRDGCAEREARMEMFVVGEAVYVNGYDFDPSVAVRWVVEPTCGSGDEVSGDAVPDEDGRLCAFTVDAPEGSCTNYRVRIDCRYTYFEVCPPAKTPTYTPELTEPTPTSVPPTPTKPPTVTPSPTPLELVSLSAIPWSQICAEAGDIVQGLIVIVSHGTEPRKDIVVADMLSDCLIPLRIETSRGIISFSPPQLTVRLGRIKPGQKVEILTTALVGEMVMAPLS